MLGSTIEKGTILTYRQASIETVIQSYQAGTVGKPFSCANNEL